MNVKQYNQCEMLGIASCDWLEELTERHIKTFQVERSNTAVHLYSKLYLQIAMFNFEEYDLE